MQPFKQRHKGWIWGVFVAPEYRGKGVARALLVRLLDILPELPELECVLLKVATTQREARRLYMSVGFRAFGIEPRSLKVNDSYIDEEHMILDVRTFLVANPTKNVPD
jgi:ribosomal protein S18 acetylase RimI-like enzyme